MQCLQLGKQQHRFYLQWHWTECTPYTSSNGCKHFHSCISPSCTHGGLCRVGTAKHTDASKWRHDCSIDIQYYSYGIVNEAIWCKRSSMFNVHWIRIYAVWRETISFQDVNAGVLYGTNVSCFLLTLQASPEGACLEYPTPAPCICSSHALRE